MKIQIGEIVLSKITEQKIVKNNRSRKYLLPAMKEYGETFTDKLNKVFKVAVGIGDMIVGNRRELIPERHLFILLDSKTTKRHFLDFMKYIREHHSFIDDYVYDDIQKSTFHMVILKFPEKFNDTIKTFKEGKYSQMFDKDAIQTLFINHPDTVKVLIQDKEYVVTFTRKINRRYGSDLKPEDWKGGELDFPPTDEMEVFNNHLKPKQ